MPERETSELGYMKLCLSVPLDSPWPSFSEHLFTRHLGFLTHLQSQTQIEHMVFNLGVILKGTCTFLNTHVSEVR